MQCLRKAWGLSDIQTSLIPSLFALCFFNILIVAKAGHRNPSHLLGTLRYREDRNPPQTRPDGSRRLLYTCGTDLLYNTMQSLGYIRQGRLWSGLREAQLAASEAVQQMVVYRESILSTDAWALQDFGAAVESENLRPANVPETLLGDACGQHVLVLGHLPGDCVSMQAHEHDVGRHYRWRLLESEWGVDFTRRLGCVHGCVADGDAVTDDLATTATEEGESNADR